MRLKSKRAWLLQKDFRLDCRVFIIKIPCNEYQCLSSGFYVRCTSDNAFLKAHNKIHYSKLWSYTSSALHGIGELSKNSIWILFNYIYLENVTSEPMKATFDSNFSTNIFTTRTGDMHSGKTKFLAKENSIYERQYSAFFQIIDYWVLVESCKIGKYLIVFIKKNKKLEWI